MAKLKQESDNWKSLGLLIDEIHDLRSEAVECFVKGKWARLKNTLNRLAHVAEKAKMKIE